ncbi:MAG TPA: hypothetical protein VLF93_03090 [Candidatus Saccharimonadales bacterium]|nr:hypothetical protein [Candidatus Saccharimonadales bacterium]
MLTNDDLRKIGDLIDERLEIKLEEKLETKLEEKLERKFEEKLAPIKKDIQTLKKSDKAIRKDLKVILRYLDRERAIHDRRITRIEDHLHLAPLE